MFYACQQLYGKVEIPEKYKDSKSLFAGCVPTLTITATNYNTGKTLQNVWIKFNMVYYDQGLTDENGQITFKGAQNLPEGSCILKFMYGGIVKNQEFTFTLNENAELNVTFGGPGEVLADNKIFGTITNSSIPISNAEVHVSNSTDGDIAIVHTNMDGSYEVPNLPNEDYVVKVTYRNTVGQEETTIADADQQVDIDLDIPEETYKLTGTVTNKDSGEPIEGIYVIVTDESDNEIGSIYSEEDGTYEIGNLPNGDYTIIATYTDPTGTIEDIVKEVAVTIENSDKQVDIELELPNNHKVTGTITDSNTKNPLPDVEVKLVDKDGKEIIVVKTGEDGTYEIPNLPDGDYKLIVTYKDPDGDPDQDITKEVEVTINGADEEVNIELPIPRRFKISGTVTWKLTGKPVALADIELKDEAGNTLKTVKTDNQGYYEFIGLTEGTYKVLATYKGSGEGIEAIIIDTKKEGED